MPKTAKTPASVLIELMEEYQINAFALSKELSLSASSVRQIVTGKGKISVPTALRLSKFFGQPNNFWTDLQCETDMAAAAKDVELCAILKGISKAKKPDAKPKKAAKVKPLKKTSLADKRKKAAKTSARKTKPKPKAK